MIFQRFFKVKIVRINTKSQADMQGWVSLFREFFKQITFLLWVKERFTLEKEQIAHGPAFLKSNGRDSLKIELLDRVTRANGSLCFLKKGNGAKSDRQERSTQNSGKAVKNCQKPKKIWFFRENRSFLRAIRSNHERITHDALFKEQCEQIAHSRS